MESEIQLKGNNAASLRTQALWTIPLVDIRKGIQRYKTFAIITSQDSRDNWLSRVYVVNGCQAAVYMYVLWSEHAAEASLGPSTAAERTMQALRQGQQRPLCRCIVDCIDNVICNASACGFVNCLVFNDLLLKALVLWHCWFGGRKDF